jgi:hypothetical protein
MVGECVRNLRKWRGLTQVLLSQASGVVQNYIRLRSAGPRGVPVRMCDRAWGWLLGDLRLTWWPYLSLDRWRVKGQPVLQPARHP